MPKPARLAWRSLRETFARGRRFASHAPTKASVSSAHWEESWPEDVIRSKSPEHVLTTWGAGGAVRGVPLFVRGEGVRVYDAAGKEYIDWTSQAVCCNLGHTVPESVKQAALKQMGSLPFVYTGFGLYENRVRLANLMSELLPGDITGFLFPAAGSEANEAAIRMARRFTGKTKIMNQYVSYHGGTTASLSATGDFRRGFVEAKGGDGGVGFIKTINPTDSHLFSFGATDEERTAKALGMLEAQIQGEGPGTIAAIMFESITGSAGVYRTPEGYMEGVRSLCDKYGILLILDEVMVGFGRTGKMWGFQHYDVIPDIVTSAKGLTGAWAPLSMLACRAEIKDFFEKNPLGWGSTFHAHPVSVAVGYASVKHMLEIDLVGHVKNNVEPVMIEEVNWLVETYKSVSSGRALGGFGCVDLIDPRTGAPIQQFSGADCSNPGAIVALKAALAENGLVGFVRPPKFHCAPPLVISPEDLREAFRRARKALDAYEASF